MDSLEELPIADTRLTAKEQAVVERLFGTEAGTTPPPSSAETTPGADDPRKSRAPPLNRRLALLCLTGAFVVLSNPWGETVWASLPKCGSSGVLFAVKTLIFLILGFVILLWIL